MSALTPSPQIVVLDAGGQYCHLIARRVRDLGVYSEVRPSSTPAAQLSHASGIIISGGPSSVYDRGSPQVDPALFQSGRPVLGICYGLHLMAQALGGSVRKGDRGEFGLATLELGEANGDALFAGIDRRQQIWMSHRDSVTSLPPGFDILGRTADCEVAAIGSSALHLYGIQFHPEVVHTTAGRQILANFLFSVCRCRPDWEPRDRVSRVERQIQEAAVDRNVFFFASGGVDSTVAYTLCLRALGKERVRGVYVDTGLMRAGETEFVRSLFDSLGADTLDIVHAEEQFLSPLADVCDPERKRHIIGEEFVRVQERIIEQRGLLDGHWMLGQGTIYPDTIESGGTERAEVIKTHHNRVAGIQRLIQAGRIVEPLSEFYKDEVREIGRELGLGDEILARHPFPGPGLAIRCLCSETNAPVTEHKEGWIAPVHSVGVQGDSRSYAPVLVIDRVPEADLVLQEDATDIINRLPGINRVIARVASSAPVLAMQVRARTLTRERLDRLRLADAAVRRLCRESGFDARVWQFPVILIPLGAGEAPDSVVLRPVDSVDGMTAQSVGMQPDLLRTMAAELLAVDGVSGVFYDLTNKPPGTIEWE